MSLTNTNRLDQLIQDTLDVSRLESGTMKFIPEKTRYREIKPNATETIQSSADAQKQITITRETEQDIPEMSIDQERIKQ